MGYHADVYKGLADLIIAALPSDIPCNFLRRIDILHHKKNY